MSAIFLFHFTFYLNDSVFADANKAKAAINVTHQTIYETSFSEVFYFLALLRLE